MGRSSKKVTLAVKGGILQIMLYVVDEKVVYIYKLKKLLEDIPQIKLFTNSWKTR